MYVICSSARMPGQGLCLPSQKPACGSPAIIASKKKKDFLKLPTKIHFSWLWCRKKLSCVLPWQKHGQRDEQGRGWLLRRPPRQPLIAGLVVFVHLSVLSDLPPDHCRFAVPWLLAASLSSAASASFLLSAFPLSAPLSSYGSDLWDFLLSHPLVLTEE